MENETNEFSFILKPSKYGVGVFATHNIGKGARLRLWGKQIEDDKDRARVLDKKKVPEALRGYCIDRGEKLLCPNDFGFMEIGWYVNHSDNPNAYQEKYKWFFAKQDIKEGEEILIDYNSLDEPEENREDYYKKVS